MNSFEQNSLFANALREIDRSAQAINERGYDDSQKEWDDYSLLLQSYEFRKLVTFELYEGYFPPRRHEFELHLLTQLVDAVASSKPATFLVEATAAGVVGNAVYDMLKSALAHTVRQFKKIKRTHDAVREIAENVESIRAYMDSHDEISTTQISSDLDIESHKVESILKLLGCRCHRVKKRRLWRRPEVW